MTEPVQIALIVGAAPTILALSSAILGWVNRNKLQQVSAQVDGRLTELLELTRKSSHAEGVKDQKETQ